MLALNTNRKGPLGNLFFPKNAREKLRMCVRVCVFFSLWFPNFNWGNARRPAVTN